MKVIGYGICGPGEANRYMRETLEEFKRLCDVATFLVNVHPDNLTGCTDEINLIEEYGFSWTIDTREWGKFQWKMKQDFIDREVSVFAQNGDMMVALDMDEVLDPHLTKEWLLQAELDAYNVFVVDLWNDPEHYKPESCFWNIRLWRWNGVTKFKAKPVHCGIAPEWTYHYSRWAPFILKHYGLMKKEDRAKKIARYEKYDPDKKYLGHQYYWMLTQDTAEPFDEEALHTTIANEVATYKQTKPRNPLPMTQKKQRYAYVQNPAGATVDIPEKHLKQTLARQGFRFIGWADDAQEEIAKMFDDADDSIQGSYQRPMADEQNELKERESNAGKLAPKEVMALFDENTSDIVDVLPAKKARKSK